LSDHNDIFERILSLFMSEDDVQAYSNLEYSTSVVRQCTPLWQPLASIGVQIGSLISVCEGAPPPALAEIARQVLEPVEALYKAVLDGSLKLGAVGPRISKGNAVASDCG